MNFLWSYHLSLGTISQRMLMWQSTSSDASEDAYSGVVYLWGEDSNGNIHVSLTMAKTRVSPIKRLTIPCLELCGAQLLSKLLHHTRRVYQVPMSEVYAWTNSTIILNWWMALHDVLKCLLATVFHLSSIMFPPRVGTIYEVEKIQQTVPLEVYSRVN